MDAGRRSPLLGETSPHMDIKFSPEEESFRQQARAWLETNKPKDPPPENDLRKRREYDLAWQRRMYDGGWAGISWPKEFGGRGASLMEQLIIRLIFDEPVKGPIALGYASHFGLGTFGAE